MADIDDLDSRLRDGTDRISGRLRITAPVDLGRNRIAPILDGFTAAHPAVSIELILADGFGDLVSENNEAVEVFGRKSYQRKVNIA